MDGAVDSDASRRVQAHVVRCPTCADALRRARSVKETLTRLPMLGCPDDITESIMRAASRSPDSRRYGRNVPARRTRFTGWRPALAAAVVVGVAATLLWGVPEPPARHATPMAPPAFTAADLRRAEQQVGIAVALLHRVGERSVRAAAETAFERGVVGPAETVVARIFRAGAGASERADSPENGADTHGVE